MEDRIYLMLGEMKGQLNAVAENQVETKEALRVLSQKVNTMDVTAAAERAETKSHRSLIASCVAIALSIIVPVVTSAFRGKLHV